MAEKYEISKSICCWFKNYTWNAQTKYKLPKNKTNVYYWFNSRDDRAPHSDSVQFTLVKNSEQKPSRYMEIMYRFQIFHTSNSIDQAETCGSNTLYKVDIN